MSITQVTLIEVQGTDKLIIRKDETATMLASLYVLTPDGLIRDLHHNRKLGTNACSLRQAIYEAARAAGFKFKPNYTNK